MNSFPGSMTETFTAAFTLAILAASGTAVTDTGEKQSKNPLEQNTPGGVADRDNAITAAIRSKLARDSHAGYLVTYVEARQGHVTLFGTAQSTAASRMASRIAGTTPEVVYVGNHLIVTNTTPEQGEIVPLTTMAFTESTRAGMTAGAATSTAVAGSGTDGTGPWITPRRGSTSVYSGRADAVSIFTRTCQDIIRPGASIAGGVASAVPATGSFDIKLPSCACSHSTAARMNREAIPAWGLTH